jgi:hypothetical protein
MQVRNSYTGVSAYFESIGSEDNFGWGGSLYYTYEIYLTGGTNTTIANPLSVWRFTFRSGFPSVNQENKYVGIRYSYDNKLYIFQLKTPLSTDLKIIVMPRDALYIG